jgi:hypothetical protein
MLSKSVTVCLAVTALVATTTLMPTRCRSGRRGQATRGNLELAALCGKRWRYMRPCVGKILPVLLNQGRWTRVG